MVTNSHATTPLGQSERAYYLSYFIKVKGSNKDMSGLLKTVSSLGQNFFACLPATSGREAFAVLEKPGGLPTRRVGAGMGRKPSGLATS